MTQVDGLMSGY